MATLSVAGTQSAGDFISQQLRTQQAQRRAEQADAVARALRAQASSAQQAADQAQENARNLKVRSDQAQGEAGSARQAVSSLESLSRVDRSFQSIREGIATGLAAIDAAPAPVVNAEGQTTGTLVNVTA
ncbi:MAG: hypothetical protein HYU78_00305 [Rhodocyclales bacterium]|nr:hypothetical protein [Rhodocyclales bacterium]